MRRRARLPTNAALTDGKSPDLVWSMSLGWRKSTARSGSCFATCSIGLSAAQPAFYSATRQETVGPPGTLIREEPMSFPGGAAYRILYRSTGLNNEAIAVSGGVVAPPGPPPPGGRPIVAWAHPTTGVVSRCAPSLARVFFGSVQGLRAMLARGYVMAATDYPGLGTSEVHPYLVGESEAQAGPQVPCARQEKFRAPGPGTGLRCGVIPRVGRPRSSPVWKLHDTRPGAQPRRGGCGGPRDGGEPQAEPAIDRLANLCIERWFDVLTRRGPTQALKKSFLRVDNLAEREPWRRLLEENSPAPLPSDIPVFLAQGSADRREPLRHRSVSRAPLSKRKQGQFCPPARGGSRPCRS